MRASARSGSPATPRGIRGPGNVAGVHLYSFGGAARTAAWMRERIAG